MGQNQTVILLHGIFRTRAHMRKLAVHLAAEGYSVLNLNYPSTKQPLEALAAGVWADIQAQADPDRPLHFVGYSMGGLLVRAVLNRYRPAFMGRAVLLAAPNKGSEIADFLKNNWLYQTLYGPAGQQLITDQSEIKHLFGTPDYECGVIAGNRSIDPISSLLIEGENDGKVSIESTKIDGMTDHIVVPANHTWFPQNAVVQQQTAHFLRHGMFLR